MLRQQAAAGDIVLLFGDESGALTHPYLAHAWAERGADLRVPAPSQARKRALLGVRDHGSGELVVHVSASKRSTDFIALLEILDLRYGPKPGRATAPVVLVLDHGPIHTSRLVANMVIDQETVTRTFPDGPGEVDVVALDEVENGRIAKAWFKRGSPCLL